jgi:hypothetical protein
MCIDNMVNDAADAIEELQVQMPKRGVDEIPKRIMGYDTEKLLLFAKMCEENDVTEHDLKQASWNLEFAVRAVMNERQEIVKNTMDEITMWFTPDFEKAFSEMRCEHDGET